MADELDPIVGNWYRHLDKGQAFKVVAVDEEGGIVAIQHFDGALDSVEIVDWGGLPLEGIEEPEDWTGPVDDVEPDDLGYSETDMTAADWRQPVEDAHRDSAETWEDVEPEGERDEWAEGDAAEELYDPTGAPDEEARSETETAEEPPADESEARWTVHELEELKERLLRREAELRADILRELEKCDREQYGALVDRVADPGEQSVADLLVDVDLAEITRDVAEVRDIEQALLRIAHGSYGDCIDCGTPIEAARLHYAPATPRCIECQERFERQENRPRPHTL